MNNEELFGDHDCTKCSRAGDCPLEGVVQYSQEHAEEIDALQEPLMEYVLASAKHFVDAMLQTSDAEEAKGIILNEIISSIVLGYVRAKMEDEKGNMSDIPEIWRAMDNE